MRIALLSLAFLYAWLPSGMCACQLQAALLPPVAGADDQTPSDPMDDDEGPHECHCTGAKPICVVQAQPCFVDQAGPEEAAIADVTVFPLETIVFRICLLAPFPHALPSALTPTLRALLI
jgi:hypothetical protein